MMMLPEPDRALDAVARLIVDPGLAIAQHIANAREGGFGNHHLENAHGLTVFLSTPQQIAPATLDAYRQIPFCQTAEDGWDEFLAAYYGDTPLGRTQGDFRFDLSWGANTTADVDLLVATPDGWVSPYRGTLPGYTLSAERRYDWKTPACPRTTQSSNAN